MRSPGQPVSLNELQPVWKTKLLAAAGGRERPGHPSRLLLALLKGNHRPNILLCERVIITQLILRKYFVFKLY